MCESKMDLPAPRIPLSDDGVIDKTDYLNNAVYAFVSYATPQIGDTIILYFDNQRFWNTTLTSASELPIVAHIDNKYLTDGSHIINYDSTDSVGNTNRSRNTSIYVDSQSDIQKITPPSIIGGEDGCLTRDEITAHDGADIFILPNAIFSEHVGSDLYLYWNEYDVQGVPVLDGSVQFATIITDQIAGNGWYNHVARDVVLSALNGGAIAFYYVQTGAERVYSEMVKVSIGTCKNEVHILALVSDRPAILADGVDSAQLTATILNSSNVPQSDEPVSWSVTSGGVLSNSRSVTDVNGLALNSLTGIAVGNIIVTARLDNDDMKHVTVTALDPNNVLPPPVFTQAESGTITSSAIQNSGGAILHIFYTGMALGDKISVAINGEEQDGSNVPDAAFSDTGSVALQNVNEGFYPLLIPETNALAVGNGGMLHANYAVTYGSTGIIHYSEYASAKIDMSSLGSELLCYLSTNSPIYDTGAVKLSPCNRGVITGQPGIPVQISCSEDAIIIDDGYQRSTAQISLDEYGHGSFQVRSVKTGNVSINIMQIDKPTNTWSGDTIFEDYKIGSGSFKVYRNTTNAPANNLTPCSVYVVTQPQSPRHAAITMVRIQVDGDAQIVGYPGSQVADVLLNSGFAAEIDIICHTTGVVNATLTLPESSGDIVKCELYFQEYNE